MRHALLFRARKRTAERSALTLTSLSVSVGGSALVQGVTDLVTPPRRRSLSVTSRFEPLRFSTRSRTTHAIFPTASAVVVVSRSPSTSALRSMRSGNQRNVTGAPVAGKYRPFTYSPAVVVSLHANGGKFRLRTAITSTSGSTQPRKLVSPGGLNTSPKRCTNGELARSSTLGIISVLSLVNSLQRHLNEVREVLLELDVRQVDPPPAIAGQLGVLLPSVDQRGVRDRVVARRDLHLPERDGFAPRTPRGGRRARDDGASQVERVHREVAAEVLVERDGQLAGHVVEDRHGVVDRAAPLWRAAREVLVRLEVLHRIGRHAREVTPLHAVAPHGAVEEHPPARRVEHERGGEVRLIRAPED